MKKFKQDELAGEASTKGLLEFSNLVVDMSNKVSAKEKRIEQLKLRLKHLNDAVKVMDESGGKNAKVFLENLRSKCLSKAANEANVELSHNREELKEVYNAKKVVFAMHQRHESLTRQYAMEFKRAPAFSDIERCNNTLKMVKEKMYLPNPHSDHCLKCKGIVDIRKNESKAYCVWPRRGNHRCEEIAFLSGKCQPPRGLPKFCYGSIVYGKKAVKDFLKKQGFPLFNAPAVSSKVVTASEIASSHIGAPANSLNLTMQSASSLLRDEMEKMKLDTDLEDDEEEAGRKRKVRKIIQKDDDEDAQTRAMTKLAKRTNRMRNI